MFEHVDAYCERLVPGFWDEPLNAVTNLSFIIAALLIARGAARQGSLRRPSLMIPLFLLSATGVGSFLFHTYANGWSAVADTAALSLCLLFTLYFGARRWLETNIFVSLLWPAGMIVAAMLLAQLVPVPGAFYLGPLAAGGAMAVAARRARHPAWKWVGAAVVVFIPSFIFRAMDEAVCAAWPYGTHFLWHILNGIVLGLAIWPLSKNDTK
ncbi:ceramidase domain-containing protein [Minwuia sp.]|uniref:ceramidase domain-containing protein n=1 Tax=Minwuia sp. TaxID=2493630 RepID=UPI003A8EB9B2